MHFNSKDHTNKVHFTDRRKNNVSKIILNELFLLFNVSTYRKGETWLLIGKLQSARTRRRDHATISLLGSFSMTALDSQIFVSSHVSYLEKKGKRATGQDKHLRIA